MRQATAIPVIDSRGRIPRHALAAMTYLAGFNGATRKNYASHLRVFFSWCDAVDIDPLEATRPHLELYIRHCENVLDNQPSTVTHKLGVLRGYYDMAVEDGYIEKDPSRRVRAPRFFHDEAALIGLDRTETSALIGAAKMDSPSVGALVVLMATLGLRVGEAISVRIEDFGEIQRSHTVLRVLGKGNRAATMPLPPPILRALLRAKGERTHGVLCLRESNGQPFTPAAARQKVKQLAARCGIDKPVRPHLLRHAAVTSALDAGVPLRDVQTMARHSDPRTTMRYDRARLNLDRHAAYAVSSYGTAQTLLDT